MEKSKVTRKLGVGSLSLLISIISIVFSFTYVNGNYVGTFIMRALGLEIPTSIISIILFLIAIFIGNRYRGDKFAKIGKILAMVFISIMALLSTISLIIGML
ncbi:hypothetical protein [Clostridium sp. Ade.TY]|uniref:hypothetical protein n=1 Tax=Clostridium sp. Ade.TY TaxID=1391647 RepID=UPI000401C9BE|nr:hypothetical protein [Clostridium sp. Ade.TY]